MSENDKTEPNVANILLDIQKTLQEVKDKQSRISTEVEELSLRTEHRRSGAFNFGTNEDSRAGQDGAQRHNPRGLNLLSSGEPRPVGGGDRHTHASGEIQSEYETINHRLQSKKLHTSLILSQGEKSGFKREDQPTRAIINKVAQYNETLLKLIIGLDVNEVTENSLDEIAIVSIALQYYVKSELAGLLVKGQFGQATGRFFRQLQRHSTAFSEENIEQVRTAVTLTQNTAGFNFQSQPFRGRGRGFRQNFRGGYNNSGPGRQYNDNDFYGSYVNRQIPRGRGRGFSGSTQFYQQTQQQPWQQGTPNSGSNSNSSG